MGLLQDFSSLFKMYYGTLNVINDELDYFAKNSAKIIRIFLFNPDPDLTSPKNSGSGSTPAKGSVFWDIFSNFGFSITGALGNSQLYLRYHRS
jgi:hypothetical protein